MLDVWFIFMWVDICGLMNLVMLKVVVRMFGFFLISIKRCLMFGVVLVMVSGMMVLFLVMFGLVSVISGFLIGLVMFRVLYSLFIDLVVKVVWLMVLVWVSWGSRLVFVSRLVMVVLCLSRL